MGDNYLLTYNYSDDCAECYETLECKNLCYNTVTEIAYVLCENCKIYNCYDTKPKS